MDFSLRLAFAICCSASVLVTGESETVGPSGDPAAMVFPGAKTFSEQTLRRAVASDLPLLLARRSDASRTVWLQQLEDGVRLGYRQAGFRDAAVTATVVNGRTRVVVDEGPRIRCGVVILPVESPEVAALITRALGERRPNTPLGLYEIDTAPVLDEPLWADGAPVDWTRPERYAERITTLLRQSGLVGGKVETAVAVASGRATLTVSLSEAPVAVLLGKVTVAGLDAGDGERLRRWLGLPADAPANLQLQKEVYERLRATGAFVDVRVVWEDEVRNLPPAMLSILTVDQVGESLRQDAEVMARRIAACGRADLLVTVRLAEHATMPWDEASRTRSCVLAARAALMRRIAGGADLVATTSLDGARIKLVWSPARGVAWLHDPGAGRQRTTLVVGDGWLATGRAGRQLRAPMPFPHLSITLGPNQGEDRERSPFSLSANCSTFGAQPRLMLDLLPAGFASMLLRTSQDVHPAESWDGDVLVLRYPVSGAEVRCDPVAGPSVRITPPQRDAVIIALQDGVWDGEVAPLLTGGLVPEHKPVGTVLGEAIAAVRETIPEAAAVPGLARAAAVANSGAIDALLELTADHRATTKDEEYGIPADGPRRPHLPMMQYLIASIAAYSEGMLYDRLADDAWPRLLLRSTALAMCGDMRSAAAGLKQVLTPGQVGPIGCLVFAHAARMTGNTVLAGLLADAGVERCDADGLVLEARTLSGLGPALLPAMGAIAEVLAAVEQDPVRTGALRGLASTCYGTAVPPVRMEAAARQAAALGVGEALKSLFAELRADGIRPTM
jgi:hypothetical protein